MATTLMRAKTRYEKVEIRVELAGGTHAAHDANAVEIAEGGVLILRDGNYDVQTVFAPGAWIAVNRR